MLKASVIVSLFSRNAAAFTEKGHRVPVLGLRRLTVLSPCVSVWTSRVGARPPNYALV